MCRVCASCGECRHRYKTLRVALATLSGEAALLKMGHSTAASLKLQIRVRQASSFGTANIKQQLARSQAEVVSLRAQLARSQAECEALRARLGREPCRDASMHQAVGRPQTDRPPSRTPSPGWLEPLPLPAPAAQPRERSGLPDSCWRARKKGDGKPMRGAFARLRTVEIEEPALGEPSDEAERAWQSARLSGTEQRSPSEYTPRYRQGTESHLLHGCELSSPDARKSRPSFTIREHRASI